MIDVIAIISFIVYSAGMLVWCVTKWVDYGIYENNLLRCLIHTLLAPVWPIALTVRAVRAIRKYAHTQFERDYVELFGTPPSPPAPRFIPVEQLAESKPSYTPGDWIN